MVAIDLAMQEATASAARLLTHLSQSIPVSAPEGFNERAGNRGLMFVK